MIKFKSGKCVAAILYSIGIHNDYYDYIILSKD